MCFTRAPRGKINCLAYGAADRMGYDPANASVLLFEGTAGAQLCWDPGLLSPSLAADQVAMDLSAGTRADPAAWGQHGPGDLRHDMQRAVQAPAPA